MPAKADPPSRTASAGRSRARRRTGDRAAAKRIMTLFRLAWRSRYAQWLVRLTVTVRQSPAPSPSRIRGATCADGVGEDPPTPHQPHRGASGGTFGDPSVRVFPGQAAGAGPTPTSRARSYREAGAPRTGDVFRH